MTFKELLKSLFKDNEEALKQIEKADDPTTQKPDLDKDKEINLDELKHNKEAIEKLVKQNQALIQQSIEKDKKIDELTTSFQEFVNKQEQDKKDREERLQKEAKEQLDAKIAKLIEDAKTDGRLPAANEQAINDMKKLLEVDFETASRQLETMTKTVAKDERQTIQGGQTTTKNYNPSLSVANQAILDRVLAQPDASGTTTN